MLGRITLVGVGLIGGSFALALKSRGEVGEVVGLGRTRASLDLAQKLGIIDRIESDPVAALEGSQLVLIAAPVAQTATILQGLLVGLGKDTVVTDAGSTKADVVSAAREVLITQLGRFVPGHPIAGAHESGPAAARADLFVGKRVVLTPLAETDGKALALVRSAWQACGAHVTEMDATRHDRVLAAVSHAPHMIAFAAMAHLAVAPNVRELFDYAGSGLRDFSRIAASNPEMWRDIALANRAALLAELDGFLAQCAGLREALAGGDAQLLLATFERARAAREELAKLAPPELRS